MSTWLVTAFIAAAVLASWTTAGGSVPSPPPAPAGMALVAGGSYRPFYSGVLLRAVPPFFMDTMQVTNGQFLDFVTAHPEWRRSRVGRSQADASYLQHWAGDLDLGPQAGVLRDAPVTHVSWHAAMAWCQAQGRRLPTQDEWEFAARADATRVDASSDPVFLNQLLEWYSKPAVSVLPPASSAPLNVHGLRGLHGVVWEWVRDFNAAMITGDARNDGSPDRQLFCGAGSLLASDAGNYAAYMRYAFRSSLKGSYCVASLGFRAAQSVNGPPAPPPPASPGADPAISTVYDLPGEWRTQDGGALNLARLRGKVRVVTMGFTRCKFACPRTLGDMQRIEQALGAQADRTGFVFLSIDPEHDTPAQMTATIKERHLNPAHWTFLTAPESAVRQAAVALDFKYQVVEGLFAHSNLIAVLDEEGRIVHREEALNASIQPTVDAILALLLRQG